ncbi:hypothetical protein [Nonomuraea sp. LPB2021202275-12-8]|uniref:hypothetical protein n=1 Tax=Nonomuraea sp. LPB2021202275-12-8 TaxID=3120159 RepID=UPI00300C8C5E
MADQFDVIEVGERGRRRWTGLAVVLVLVGVPVIGLLASREPPPEPAPQPAPIQSLTRVDSAPNVLQAPGKHTGDIEILDVVFPDGQRAEVRYPAELDLDRLGSRPFQGVWVGGHYRQLVAPYNGEIEVTKGGQPIRKFAPHVTLWPRQPGSGSYGQVLLFAFGSWRMAMYDRQEGLDFDDRMALAEGLSGDTEDGYLVLSGPDLKTATETASNLETDAVRLARPGENAMGDPAGPQLWFGGGASDMVILIPTPGCKDVSTLPRGIRGRGTPVRDVCRSGVRIAVLGDDRFVSTALDRIRVKLK